MSGNTADTAGANTESGNTTTHVTDPNAELPRLLIKKNPDGTSTFYVYGHGLVSQEAMDGDGHWDDYRLYHYNHLGSTVALTDGEGNVTDTMAYSPYGGIEDRTGDTDAVFLYVGREGVQTDGNGLLYMRARYYSPEMGCFINEDPIRDGENWHQYCGGDPINNTDPTGLKKKPANFEKYFNKTYKKIENNPKDPIQVKVKGNKITVTAYVYITGKYADKEFFGFYTTYRREIIKGIEEKWSGSFKMTKHKYKVSVKTTVIDLNDGKRKDAAVGQTRHFIQMKQGKGTACVSNMYGRKWRKNKSYRVHLYSAKPTGTVLKPFHIRNTAAHEFGHLLGSEDSYWYKVSKQSLENDIMRWSNRDQDTKMSKYNVWMFLYAFAYNEFQSWTRYGMEVDPDYP